MYVEISCDSVNPVTLSPVQMKSVYVSNTCCWSKQDLTNLTLFVLNLCSDHLEVKYKALAGTWPESREPFQTPPSLFCSWGCLEKASHILNSDGKKIILIHFSLHSIGSLWGFVEMIINGLNWRGKNVALVWEHELALEPLALV